MNMAEFRPALRFLGIFLGVYFGLNLVYGIWIESLDARPDGATVAVSHQTADLLKWLDYEVTTQFDSHRPTVQMLQDGRTILSVFEGCNGINVMIVFVSFVLAFGGHAGKMLWFLPLGLSLIHLSNLLRIALLYWLSESGSHYFYYFHKYFFTAVIFLVVFILWWLWVILNSGKKPSQPQSAHSPL